MNKELLNACIEKPFIDIPNIEAITVQVKYRSVVELELQKYFKKNEAN